MVSSVWCSDSKNTTLTIAPNRSLSWKQSLQLLLFLSTCLISIAIFFALQGAWLVIPFTGIEIGLLSTALYLQSRWSYQKQIIQIDDQHIRIKTYPSKLPATAFNKAWLQIKLIKDPSDWYPSHLTIGIHGRFQEIGKWLVESEHLCLAQQIRATIKHPAHKSKIPC